MGVFRIMYYWCQTLRAAEKQRGPACLATAPCCGLLPGVTVDEATSKPNASTIRELDEYVHKICTRGLGLVRSLFLSSVSVQTIMLC